MGGREMHYFNIHPSMLGWTSSKALAASGLFPNEDFLPYKSKRKQEEISAAVEEARERYSTPAAVNAYHRNLDATVKRDIVVVTTGDTLTSKPPFEQRELPATHPANKNVPELCKRLKQLREKTGLTGYIAVVYPPYFPAVILPEHWPKKLLPSNPVDLNKFYQPHMFLHWDSLDAQEKKIEKEIDRAAAYALESGHTYEITDNVKEWNRDFERLCLIGLEAVIAEHLTRFVSEKCREEFYILMPNSPTKKQIKQRVMEEVAKRRPELIKNKSTVDIAGNFIFTEGYRESSISSPSIINRLTTILENRHSDFLYRDLEKPTTFTSMLSTERRADYCPHGPILCEFSPERGEDCGIKGNEKLCMLDPHMNTILNSSPNRKEILRFMKEKNINPVSIYTILKDLNFDLEAELKPLEIPLFKVRREDAETSCSEISGSMDAAEFFLKKVGALEVSPDIRFRAKVGTVCHELAYAFAPPHWKLAMEKPMIRSFVARKGPAAGKKISIHFQPDIICYYSRDIGIVPVDTKSGVAPFQRWFARKSHMEQLAGYGWALEGWAQDNGLENPIAEFGVVHYLQDYQTHRYSLRKVDISEDSTSRGVFLGKAETFVGKFWEWRNNPQKFFEEYETGYRVEHAKDDRGRRCITAVEKFKQNISISAA